MTADATLSVERDIYGSYWADGSENIADLTSQNFEIDSAVVDPETRFDLHYHSKDQLAWMPGGAMELTVSGTRWHLRRDRFAWIPAGTLHEMAFTEPGEVINLYTDVRLRPRGERWTRSCVVEVEDLAGSLLWHLVNEPRDAARARLCLSLLCDLLQSATVSHDTLALPADPRAQRIAARLLADPADARAVGLGSRTRRQRANAHAGLPRERGLHLPAMAAVGPDARGSRVARPRRAGRRGGRARRLRHVEWIHRGLRGPLRHDAVRLCAPACGLTCRRRSRGSDDRVR